MMHWRRLETKKTSVRSASSIHNKCAFNGRLKPASSSTKRNEAGNVFRTQGPATFVIHKYHTILRHVDEATIKRCLHVRTRRSIHKRSYDSSRTYAGRTTSILHRLLFTKHGVSIDDRLWRSYEHTSATYLPVSYERHSRLSYWLLPNLTCIKSLFNS